MSIPIPPDGLSLNQLAKQLLAGLQIASDPPYLIQIPVQMPEAVERFAQAMDDDNTEVIEIDRTRKISLPDLQSLERTEQLLEARVFQLISGLGNPEVVVGRAGDCDVILNGSTVSKHHAVMYPIGSEAWEVRDTGSQNGTFVKGTRLPERVSVKLPREGGVQVWFASYRTLFLFGQQLEAIVKRLSD